MLRMKTSRLATPDADVTTAGSDRGGIGERCMDTTVITEQREDLIRFPAGFFLGHTHLLSVVSTHLRHCLWRAGIIQHRDDGKSGAEQYGKQRVQHATGKYKADEHHGESEIQVILQ